MTGVLVSFSSSDSDSDSVLDVVSDSVAVTDSAPNLISPMQLMVVTFSFALMVLVTSLIVLAVSELSWS